MVRATAKAAGITEPTAEEKDPAWLALQVRSLHGTVQNFVKAQESNLQNIQRAFSMVDTHQQILARITRDLASTVFNVRRLFVDGDITLTPGDFGVLKLRTDGTLDMHAYYETYRKVGTAAGDAADLAVLIWSQGQDPEEAVTRAKLERQRQLEAGEKPAQELDYETEEFGGNSGQDHHEQVQASAQANG